MRKPRIAVTPRLSHEQLRQGDNSEYFDAILSSGGIPYMVALNTDCDIIAEDFDGLLITGGEDIYPDQYNEEICCPIETSTREIDQFDYDLIHAFFERKKPILGICRGIQCVNVAFGGTLYQDLAMQYAAMRTEGHQQHQMSPPLGRHDLAHAIQVMNKTHLSKLMDADTWVNSYHHQNIKQLAQGFTISAVSDDGLIEAIEYEDFLLCVQWHPERLIHLPQQKALFLDFVSRAAQVKEKES